MKKYRLKDEKYRKLAQEIAGFNKDGIKPLEFYVSQEISYMRERLEEYGVFDLWFEEVQEPEYKPGDYIYTKNTGNVYKIKNCKVIVDELHWNTAGVDRGEFNYGYFTHLTNIRPATAKEIEEHNRQLPVINGYKGKQEGDYITYGCQRIHVQDFRKLYEGCLHTNVTSITIAGQQVQMETLQEIYKKTF